jgi:hypothetical protein
MHRHRHAQTCQCRHTLTHTSHTHKHTHTHTYTHTQSHTQHATKKQWKRPRGGGPVQHMLRSLPPCEACQLHGLVQPGCSQSLQWRTTRMCLTQTSRSDHGQRVVVEMGDTQASTHTPHTQHTLMHSSGIRTHNIQWMDPRVPYLTPNAHRHARCAWGGGRGAQLRVPHEHWPLMQLPGHRCCSAPRRPGPSAP